MTVFSLRNLLLIMFVFIAFDGLSRRGFKNAGNGCCYKLTYFARKPNTKSTSEASKAGRC